jgi:hypothetical protein
MGHMVKPGDVVNLMGRTPEKKGLYFIKQT